MARITAELTKGERYSAFIDLPANKRQLQDAKWRARFNGEADGMFIDGMYVEIGNYAMPEEYDGEHIPDIDSGDISVSLANKDTGMTDSFQLPVDSDTLDRIAEKYDFEGIIDVTDQSGNIRVGMIKSAADFEALNKLAENLNFMTDEEHIVFSAAVQSEDPSAIEAMLDISEHTAEYELDRDATYYDNFGREYIEAFLPEDFDTEILDSLGTYKFGEMVAKKIGASIADYGMISERGRQLVEMVYKEDKMPIIFDDGEENEVPDRTEDETENAEEVTDQDEDIEEDPPDEEQNYDPEQALTDEHFEVVEIFGQDALFTEGKPRRFFFH